MTWAYFISEEKREGSIAKLGIQHQSRSPFFPFTKDSNNDNYFQMLPEEVYKRCPFRYNLLSFCLLVFGLRCNTQRPVLVQFYTNRTC